MYALCGDPVTPGTGQNYIEGNAGNDTIDGGGGGWVIGDNGTNLAPFVTEMPHVARGIDLVPADGVDLGGLEPLRAPNVTILPHLVHHEDSFRVVIPHAVTVGDFGDIAHDLHDLDAHLDHIHHLANSLDLVSGNDDLRGGGGADVVIGDNATIVAPVVLMDPNPAGGDDDDDRRPRFKTLIPDALSGVRAEIEGVVNLVRGDLPPPSDDDDDSRSRVHHVDLTVVAGNDTIRGGAGDDILIGDDATIIAPLAKLASLPAGTSGGDDDDRVPLPVIHHITVIAGDDTMEGNGGADLILGDFATFFAIDVRIEPGAGADSRLELGGILRSAEDGDERFDAVAQLLLGDVEPIIVGVPQADHPSHGDGDDDDSHPHGLTIIGGDDTLDGGEGNDVMFGDDAAIFAPAFVGGADLPSTPGMIVIPLGGDDDNDGRSRRGGNDEMRGGAGDDIMFSGPGRDTLFGDSGSDTLYVDDDEGDRADGGAGNDRIVEQEDGFGLGAGDDDDAVFAVLLVQSPWLQQFLLDVDVADDALDPTAEFLAVLTAAADDDDGFGVISTLR